MKKLILESTESLLLLMENLHSPNFKTESELKETAKFIDAYLNQVTPYIGLNYEEDLKKAPYYLHVLHSHLLLQLFFFHHLSGHAMDAHERFNSVAKKYITCHSMNNGGKSKAGRKYKTRFTNKEFEETPKISNLMSILMNLIRN